MMYIENYECGLLAIAFEPIDQTFKQFVKYSLGLLKKISTWIQTDTT